MPLYKITFTDNSVFLGGDTIEDSKWEEIPDKAILRLEYFLSSDSSLVLQNFEEYALFSEGFKDATINLGDCPKCGAKGKLSKATFKGQKDIFKKIVARCKNDKCNWIGEIKDLKNNIKINRKADYKYVMGLKNGIITSYRIALKGKKGLDKYEKGDVTHRDYPKGKEYRGKPIADWVWKKGKN